MKLQSFSFCLFFAFINIHCGQQETLSRTIEASAGEIEEMPTASGNEAENSCQEIPENFCQSSEMSVSLVDDNGCEYILCAPPTSPGGQPAQNDSSNSGNQNPNPIVLPDGVEDSVCERIHMGGGVYRDLKVSDGFVDRYSATVGSYYPRKGRYVNGVSMFCEKQTIRCTVGGRIGGRITGARYIADRDNSKCNASLFAGHPEYVYKTYKDWYVMLQEEYGRCQSREPSPDEVETHITDMLENGVSETTVKNQICNP